MKFTTAWAKVASENANLKLVIICLSLVCLFFGVATLKLSVRDAIVVERACYSRALLPVSPKRTALEIESFLREALDQRFNTQTVVHDNFLAADERLIREQEQKELAVKHLTQKVLLNSVEVDGNQITINSDRLISVGDVRSALSFPLVARIESVTRTEGNPYGLVLSQVTAIQKVTK